MASKRNAPTQKNFKHTWYFREWMEQAGKRQVDLIKELGWSKAKANEVWNGQQYTQALVDELVPYLNIRPFEMLLAPQEAFSIRAMREAAVRLAAERVPGEAPSAANTG